MSAKIKPPVAAGKEYNIEVTGLGHSGEGVGRYEGFTIFVEQAMPGEQVRVKITEVKKNYARGELRGMIASSPHRVEPRCAIYQSCGGCQLQHMAYAEQLNWKRQVVVDAITRIGKLDSVNVQPTLGGQDPWYYRNKMQLPVGQSNGAVVAGCYARGSHDIIDMERCDIQHAVNNDIAVQLKQIIGELGISIYDEQTGKGLVRHVLGRVGVRTGEVMVVLVTNGESLPNKERMIALIREQIPGVVSIVQNINTQRTNVIMGRETRVLWGQESITDYIGRFRFHISARAFFQVNTIQAEILYNTALQYANLDGDETVIDAYCGTGTITLFLAQKAKKVYGIEVIADAIENARNNAKINDVQNVEFFVGDAVELMPKLYEQGIHPEVIVVDPPRAGCAQEVLSTFVRMNPQRIVYVSCNPSSLARDLACLQEQGYQTREITPVDMFPHTSHVECVALIERE